MDFSQALALAQEHHDRFGATHGKELLAFIAGRKGRGEDAIQGWREAAEEYKSEGFPGEAIRMIFWIAQSCILLDDKVGFDRVVAALDDPELARGLEIHPIHALVVRGLDHLIRGDWEGCRAGDECRGEMDARREKVYWSSVNVTELVEGYRG